FKAMWMEFDSYENEIKKAWVRQEDSPSLASIYGKLKSCGSNLMSWSKEAFGNDKRSMGKLKLDLVHVQLT
ncbi:unnamed protein product, partial [Ilex paraguariensis]